MNPVSLDDMALFVEVARAGNFSRACARLGMANATLSRRIAAMERQLGLRLFERSTRHVALTDTARRFYERCAPLLDEARLAHEALRAGGAQPEGHVRVSMPVDLGVSYLGPWLPEFARRHPGITLDLDLSPHLADLRTEPVDVALRLGAGRSSGLVARRIGHIAQGLYAAPSYLERHGRPREPAELAAHDCLCVGSARRGTRWRFGSAPGGPEVAVRGRIGLNSMGLARGLAERGLGIALLPTRLAEPAVQAGALEAVLPRQALPGWPVYAVCTSRLLPAATRAFVDFVAARLAGPPA